MKKPIQEIKLRDHTCLMFSNKIEFLHCLVPFLREGLKKNEKCLIVIDDISRQDIVNRFKLLFREKNSDFNQMSTLSNITIEYFKNVYLTDNRFDMERTGSYYLTQVKEAIENGYNGLRVFVEIGSSLKYLINLDDFLSWETKADDFFPHNNLIAVCAYNKKLFSDDYINKAVKIHPIDIDIIGTRL